MRPSTLRLPRSPSACSTPNGATPARSRSSTSSASSSASPSSGSTPASSARAAPIPAQLMYQELADMACNRITAGDHPAASSASARSRRCSIPTTRPARRAHVRFNTSQDRPLGDRAARRLRPRQLGRPRQRLGGRVLPRRRVASAGARLREEPQPRPRSAVPLRLRDAASICPTSSCWWTTATAPDDLLHLVVEIKGYRREDAKEKKSTMDTYWVPGVNHLGTLRPLGLRRVHRGLSDRVRLQGQGRRSEFEHDDRRVEPAVEQVARAWRSVAAGRGK